MALWRLKNTLARYDFPGIAVTPFSHVHDFFLSSRKAELFYAERLAIRSKCKALSALKCLAFCPSGFSPVPDSIRNQRTTRCPRSSISPPPLSFLSSVYLPRGRISTTEKGEALTPFPLFFPLTPPRGNSGRRRPRRRGRARTRARRRLPRCRSTARCSSFPRRRRRRKGPGSAPAPGSGRGRTRRCARRRRCTTRSARTERGCTAPPRSPAAGTALSRSVRHAPRGRRRCTPPPSPGER